MQVRIVSSLAKVFPDEICAGFAVESVSCLKNERVAFQLVLKSDSDRQIKIGSDCEFLSLYSIRFVPASFTAAENHDSFFLRNAAPGDYPDVLIPLKDKLSLKKDEWTAVWCEFTPAGALEAGDYPIRITADEQEIWITARIVDASLGSQSLLCTHWFHTDCLAAYYNIAVFSDDYWRIVENFMREAVRHGINLLLTPLFTPPLDTEVGGERPTVQLVDVRRTAGQYAFGFEKLKKWMDLAQRCGIQYFEMAHLYTQWGAEHAPKIMAETPDGLKRIFGWETDAHGEEYECFLKQFAPALLTFLEESGVLDRCLFHTSDEPSMEQYASYKKSANLMQSLFKGCKRMDALSDFLFYQDGLVPYPIPSIGHMDEFAGKVPELWTYYCCDPCTENLPNRFLAMPALRNRILGFILYQYDAKGFLHWGFNFYYTQYSKRKVDPFTETDAGGNFAAGDSFVVYPAADGTPYISMRLKVFYEAVQDFEALRLLEQKIGREKTLALLNEGLERPITAREYPHSEEWLLKKRAEINQILAI